MRRECDFLLKYSYSRVAACLVGHGCACKAVLGEVVKKRVEGPKALDMLEAAPDDIKLLETEKKSAEAASTGRTKTFGTAALHRKRASEIEESV